MDKARELETSFEKSLEETQQQVIEGEIDTTDTNARYLGAPLLLLLPLPQHDLSLTSLPPTGYLARLRPVLISSSRYLACASPASSSPPSPRPTAAR